MASRGFWLISGSQFPVTKQGAAVPYKNGKYRAALLSSGGYVLLRKVNRQERARITTSTSAEVRLALIHSTRLPKVSVDETGACVVLEGVDSEGEFRAIIYVDREKKGEDSFRRKGS